MIYPLSLDAYPVRKMKTQVELKFSSFFEKWMGLLEEFLRYYLRVSEENSQEVDHEVLVNKLTAHHKEYYTYKWAAAHEDVLAFFAPVWLSPVENVNLWITGWKPSIAFRLIESLRKIQSPGASLATMTEEQVKKIEALRVKIKMDEEKVEREFERQQVGIADRKMVKLAALEKRVVKNGESAVTQLNGLVEVAIKGLLGGLENVMKMADCVRLKTLKGVLDILTPIQSVNFLAAMSTVQIQMRKWGKKHDKKLQ
ncbi:DOG1-like 4 [Olea europaea subsp. europaea]|uniref:DOG1-like 4 n=1 Tax=Olea europaea subsp. europaea TaxID=158383 RepID=A0A8S0PD79_OLEEU|nr:DOG1-like 4 [Olea europaea subsp. europaea]